MFTSIFTIAPAEQWERGSQKVSFPWDSQGSGVLSSMHLLIAINISYLNQSVLMNQEVSQRCWQPLGLPKVSLYASYIARNLMTSHYSLCTCWHYQPWLHKMWEGWQHLMQLSCLNMEMHLAFMVCDFVLHNTTASTWGSTMDTSTTPKWPHNQVQKCAQHNFLFQWPMSHTHFEHVMLAFFCIVYFTIDT